MQLMKVLIIGSGYMAFEYAKVLDDLNIYFSIVGRSEVSCEKLRKDFPNVQIYSGGIEKFDSVKLYTHVIIASNVDYLMNHALLMLENGIENILLEKPGGKNLFEIETIYREAKKKNSRLFVAYNRRFYSSVQKCLELLKTDSKILSFNFEFTEWPHTLENLPNQEIIKENLLYANSTHLIDLAFFFNGSPNKILSIAFGKLNWHKNAIFSGTGVASNEAIFSYHANWKAPGRWGLEINTGNNRYIFRPLEELWIQKSKSVKLEKCFFDDDLDRKFKPGLYNQLIAFLFNQDDVRLIDINKQYENCISIYEVILHGNVSV
jgi:predicted dehydrogenase